jgi:SAM-dependent methyltransferase
MEDKEQGTAVVSQQKQRNRRSISLFEGYLSLMDERRVLLQVRRAVSYSVVTVPALIQSNLVPFIPTSLETAKKMLELAQVKLGDIVYDLGCGDARILVLAADLFKASKAIGYEIRPEVYKNALKEVKARNLEEKVTVVNEDLFVADVSKATVIMLYLNHAVNNMLKQKLEMEAPHGTRIVSHDFEIHGWKPIRKLRRQGNTLYLYKVPDSFNRSSLSQNAQKKRSLKAQSKLVRNISSKNTISTKEGSHGNS